jgi:hypothetical protein
MITRATSHTLLWKNPRTPVTTAGNAKLGWALMDWQRYEWWEHELRFKKSGMPGPLGNLPMAAVKDAILARRNVTIARIEDDPGSTPSSDLLTKFAALRPATLVCPERSVIPGSNVRWIVAWLTGDARRAHPETVPETMIQAAVDAAVKEQYPFYNQAPSMYSVPNLVLRHDVTGEDLGLVERQEITPDMICASVSEYPAVVEAVQRWDRATPSTWRDLVAARLAAQERAGIPEADRCPLYSGDVEGYLMPIILRMGKGDEPSVLAQMRQHLRRTYAEHAETVLGFMLRTYAHGNTEKLLALATAAKAAA